MKKLVSILLILFSVIKAQSVFDSSFVIGADWLNPSKNFGDTFEELSNNYWDTIKSLGLNCGTMTINEKYISPITINSTLSSASSNGLKILLDTKRMTMHGNIPVSKRWMYQVEKTFDYLKHDCGVIYWNSEAETHYSKDTVSSNEENFLRLKKVDHNAGYAADSLAKKDLQPDSTTYYLKIRMRLPDFQTPSLKPVIRVDVNYNNQNKKQFIIYDTAFTNAQWKEIYIGRFYKSPTGPTDSNVNNSNITITDSAGITGLEDYIDNSNITNTEYDYEIFWYDSVDCDIDYLAVEDVNSFEIQRGDYDETVQSVVNTYKYNSGLSNLKVWDEPKYENLLTVRYIKKKIDEYLGTAYRTKGAFSFHSTFQVPETDRFLSESRLDMNMTDIYPINTSIALPNSNAYLDSVQKSFDSVLIVPLLDNVKKSQSFNKPYVFTVQAHSWPNDLREPSAFEIRAMVNLGICYGSKGIMYFMYSKYHTDTTYVKTLLDSDDNNNPTPRYTDAYGQPKWETVKQLNIKLSKIGSELMALKWLGAYSINDGVQPSNIYISNLSTTDNEDSTYIELGIFKNKDGLSDNDRGYFYIVNRRTRPGENRDITTSINKTNSSYESWLITERGTRNGWALSSSGNFSTNFQEGEGKLFKIEPFVSPNITVTSIVVEGESHPKIVRDTNLIINDNESEYVLYSRVKTDTWSNWSIKTTLTSTQNEYIDYSIGGAGSGLYNVEYKMKARCIVNNDSILSLYSNTVGIKWGNFMEKKPESIVFQYNLDQNYPNPFNPSTEIKYSIKEKGLVTIKVYDILGNVVKTLIEENKEAGNYSVTFNASNFSSGIYFYELIVNGLQPFRATKKMMLVK